MSEKIRCPWCGDTQIYVDYHDNEWGRPVHDDGKLFEMLTLECMQAGLSWITVLKKREAYRKAFDNFDPKKVALYDDAKVEELMANEGIIRHKGKIEAAVNNAKLFNEIVEQQGSFDGFIWKYVNNTPITGCWKKMGDLPATTPLSDKISKDFKKMGFKFVGSTTIYSFMQAIGMVNDHITECFVYEELFGMLDYELISDWGNKVYKNGDRVIKIYPSEEYKYAEESARRQRLAYNADLPVPAVYGIREISETEIGLEMQYLESKRFIYDGMDERARLDAYGVMVKLQCMMNAVDASELPHLAIFYIAEITENPHLTEQTKEKLLDLMKELDKGKTNLCHGDMHGHNIIFDGEKHWLIDWEDASKGDPAADACMAYFYVLRFNCKYEEHYLDIFCRESEITREEVLAWLPVIAGVQSNINDENDRAFILNFLSDII